MLTLLLLTAGFTDDDAPPRPNVLFVAVDDLNDWAEPFGGHPQVQTPHLSRLAERSVVFQNAHAAAPVCGPSRSALLTGLSPATTGCYGNRDITRLAPPVAKYATLPEAMAQHGYHTATLGKIAHAFETPRGTDRGRWMYQEIGHGGGSFAADRSRLTSRNKSLVAGQPINDRFARGGGSEFAWGPTRLATDETKDWQTADWAGDWLAARPADAGPFFLAVGFSKPHLPFIVPQEFFDLYDESFEPPEVPEDDLADIVTTTGSQRYTASDDFEWVEANDQRREAARAYAAACSYADACVGHLLEGLAKSPHAANTIVIVWGDHGWHLGEKLRYRKATGWHVATRVPLLIAMPNRDRRADCVAPVNLLDLFPTLLDVCDLPPRPHLEGRSLRPLLENPVADEKAWPHASVTIVGPNHASVHGRRYHAIWEKSRRNGRDMEVRQLYDLANDPNEWVNEARETMPEPMRTKWQQLTAALPAHYAARAPQSVDESRAYDPAKPRPLEQLQ